MKIDKRERNGRTILKVERSIPSMNLRYLTGYVSFSSEDNIHTGSKEDLENIKQELLEKFPTEITFCSVFKSRDILDLLGDELAKLKYIGIDFASLHAIETNNTMNHRLMDSTLNEIADILDSRR